MILILINLALGWMNETSGKVDEKGDRVTVAGNNLAFDKVKLNVDIFIYLCFFIFINLALG